MSYLNKQNWIFIDIHLTQTKILGLLQKKKKVPTNKFQIGFEDVRNYVIDR